MSDPAPTRLGESLKGFADSGLATLQTRLELFSVELKEEKLRAGSFLFDTVLAALFIAGVWAATRAAARLRAGSRLFSASLAEIAHDREALRRKE